MIFETPHAFDPSSEAVSVGAEAFTVLKAASEKAQRLVVEAPAMVGEAYGWLRRSDLESEDAAKPKAASKSK